MQTFDIAIIGGGMIGLTLAVGLSGQGFNIAVLDTSEPDPKWFNTDESVAPAARVSAISLASEQIFRHCQVWEQIAEKRVCSYQNMDVKEQDSFAHIHFSHEQVHQPALGHIVENERIRAALWDKAKACDDITLIAPAQINKVHMQGSTNIIQLENDSLISARLLVGADGGRSKIRQQAGFPVTFWDYGQHAIVATVKTQEAHNETARQVFTQSGPLAFLPMWKPNLCSIVWSQEVEQADALMAMSDDAFSKVLASTFDMQLGTCELITPRQRFPLRMQYARQWVSEGVVVIGDAAHTIHPLAGQGANLGLLDAAALAETLIELKQQEKDIGAWANLRAFERWRKSEASHMIASMEAFKQLFSGNNPLKKLVRGVGMSVSNALPGFKQNVILRAMGIKGELPQMAQPLSRHHG
ncbi:FAD-dependent monooxygenase [Alteromonas sp. a30]|uniref:FAD-dependent monooxygenase n=1 Tax=Alteromonas sp. a30 TaxID=2730917 RepID=UPI00228226D5|nr:FAD-dependent monooxygenase [Alteromonas sp. a30]MCY7295455.1 FAD-dependent 2-octaprenylphenol hydroxylase [Alteromonas sp. a30]